MLELLNFYLIPGLVLGAIYALAAAGVSLVYGVMRFANFMHGDMMTWGAYAALVAVLALGISPWVALPFAVAATIPVAWAADAAFFGRLRRAAPAVLLISSFGAALMIRAVVYFVFGPTPQNYGQGLVPPLLFGEVRIQQRHLFILAGAALAALALHLLLARTRAGRAMRAMADDPDLARVTGVPVAGVIRLTWAVAAALAAIAGTFLAIDTELTPMLGFNVLLAAFAAAILGGIGRPWGAALGGLLLGLAEELSSYPFLAGEPLLQPAYKTAVAFAVLVLVLIFRPQGLFRGMG
ncbi:branched-chain amino acid ABC transporter permease [Crenalkalicoccus roseus]|uniref:branched-chain amino acid ABC transporter permease n=1 Tax=Crenalkalicoccus roseus TaxID=1485588 RepID=UPI001080EF8C|nr:branched-chain amino acid ABC transporter permease [Crenalkalicoccus roseus]